MANLSLVLLQKEDRIILLKEPWECREAKKHLTTISLLEEHNPKGFLLPLKNTATRRRMVMKEIILYHDSVLISVMILFSIYLCDSLNQMRITINSVVSLVMILHINITRRNLLQEPRLGSKRLKVFGTKELVCRSTGI